MTEEIHEVLDVVDEGDLLFLDIPSWITCVESYHGTDQVVGFYRGIENDRLILTQCSTGEEPGIIKIDDIESAEIILPSKKKLYHMPTKAKVTKDWLVDRYDAIAFNHKESDAITAGFFVSSRSITGDYEAPIEDWKLTLSMARKDAYLNKYRDYDLSEFSKFLVFDEYFPDPANDGIDSLIVKMGLD